MLNSILDSALDSDKMDYLARDGLHCGVPYAQAIDQQRFFQTLTTVTSPVADEISRDSLKALKNGKVKPCIAVTNKGILPVLSILLARYMLFESIYWHHSVRAETVMLHGALLFYLDRKLQQYAQCDTGPQRTARELDGLLQDAVGEVVERGFKETDDEFLKWFYKQCCKSKCVKSAMMCEAILGQKSQCYKMVYEYKYSDRRAIAQKYDKLSNTADAKNLSPSIAECLRAYCEDFGRLARLMTVQIRALGIEVNIEPGDILIDIPPPGKDQIKNVFIVIGDEVSPIETVNPIAESVVSPAVWKSLVRHELTEEKIRRVSQEVITGFAQGDQTKDEGTRGGTEVGQIEDQALSQPTLPTQTNVAPTPDAPGAPASGAPGLRGHFIMPSSA